MRDILFRGKRIDNGEWVEGDLLREKDVFGIVNTRIYQIRGNDYFAKRDVAPETVCQYVGITDKNGQKIFDGDIINDIDYGIMRCMYLHGSFVWYKEDGFHIKCMNYIPVIEVIGNIFDNPELLKTED